MKSIYSFILMLVTVAGVSAQSVEELDKKGGFKDFKIGESTATYKERMKFTKTLDNADTKLYLVKELVSVKTYTGEVELKFYKDKMSEVIVSFKNSKKEDYDDLVKSLEVLYGESKEDKKKAVDLDRFEKVNMWEGKDIGLRIGFDANRKLSQMTFYGHANKLEKLKEEF